MKLISQYIKESIKKLNGKTGIIVFDIDDTLIQADASSIKIGKYVNGDKRNKIYLSSEEFAHDPDVKEHKDWFDFSEFQNPQKVVQSIVQGTPILKNLRILDAYINAGYEFCFLTARGCEDVIKNALDDFLKIRKNNGALEKLGSSFNKTFSHAVNDKFKNYPGSTDAEKKANCLKNLCKQYDKVVFVDDDHKNVSAARNLKISNLTVIKAWDE